MKSLIPIILSTLFLLCSCVKDDEYRKVRSVTLQAYANAEGGRAIFDGDQRKSFWASGDNLAVIFSSSGQNYGAPYNFTHQGENNEGRFQCDNVSQSVPSICDVYAFHQPNVVVQGDYNPKIHIGSAIQTQDGTSAAHVAAYDPLYGVAKDVDIDKISVSMSHMASILSFTIQNNTSSDIVLNSATITTSNNSELAKDCYFNLLTQVMTSEDNSTSVKLNFTETTTLAVGATLKAWVAVAPFELAAGDKLNFTITYNTDKSYSFTKTMAKTANFSAGKIMNLSDVISLKDSSKNVTFDFAECQFDSAESKFNFPDGESLFIATSDEKVTVSYSSLDPKGGNFKFTAKDQYADIALPKYDGYRVSSVVVSVAKGNANIKIGVVDANSEIVGDYKNANLSNDLTLGQFDNTDSSTSYYIRILSSASPSFKISKIVVNYTL